MDDGFFLVEGLIDAEECKEFASRLQEYADGVRPLPDGVRTQREPEGDAIRKVSGLVHDDLFRALISRPAIIERIRSLVGDPVQLFRADALMKPPAVGSQKGVHQDSPYWPVEPMSLWSCWVPFDDATLDNGCLTVVPGSHLAGGLPHVSADHDYVIPTEHYPAADLVSVPMERGTGIFFHSLLVHGSAANRSGSPRRAVTMSYLGPEHHYAGTGTAPAYPVVG